MQNSDSSSLYGLVLGSTSPRRRAFFDEVIGRGGYTALDPGFDESVIRCPGLARRQARLRAEGKARAVLTRYPKGRYLAVTADTVVVRGGRILDKPRSREEAAAMLRQLSGRWHRVMTAVTLAARQKDRVCVRTRVTTTRVRFARLTEAQIRWYLATGEPMDKAGAYGIQGKGALLIARIRGRYDNVVGLPVGDTLRRIRRLLPFHGDHLGVPLFWTDGSAGGGADEADGDNAEDSGSSAGTTSV